jgi:2-oxoglutarate dehydrogenase E2 component (dihydrolipoamide succinyltransferase)
MATEIRVPALGESVTEAIVGKWLKAAGDSVSVDEPVVELETDKVTVEVNAPASGVLGEIKAAEGTTVAVGALLGAIGNGAGAAAPKPAQAAPAPAEKSNGDMPPSPAARKKLAEAGIDAAVVSGSGKRGQILKEDVPAAAPPKAAEPAPVPASQPHDEDDEPAETAPQAPVFSGAVPVPVPVPVQNLRLPAAAVDAAREERVRMTKLRQTIARRLKEAQSTAAMLTTFNEVDMTNVMAVRNRYKELFEKKHGVKLGFMSFFVRAAVQALKDIPAVNAEIDGTDIIYKNYYHVGVAVGTEKGLVVPVVREAEQRSLADIEKTIADFGRRAREGTLGIDEMQGGTFTISNGGIYGSLMSTPILNAPQSGILGMHKIQERPVGIDGEIRLRPMMYLALSYDHRIVDGREAVTFLVRMKEILEDPERLILDL